MKKFFWVLLGTFSLFVPAISLASLTSSQQLSVNVAANKIVTIMERQSITMDSFMNILDGFETRLQWQDTKLMILEALREATLDEYYQVENFSACVSYYDGCNTCGVENGMLTFCTKRACLRLDTPSCEVYEWDDLWQDSVTDQELQCKNAWGQFVSVHKECENIDELTCNALGGTFSECASACRNEPEGTMCTMQCVQVCDFNGWGDVQVINDAQKELDEAVSQWESQNIADYVVTQTYSCFCPREYTRPISYIVVWGESQTSNARYNDEEMELIDPEMSPELLTVEQAFALIQDAIDQQVASITVSYDENLWYPMNIAIDYNVMMADEEVYYSFIVES